MSNTKSAVNASLKSGYLPLLVQNVCSEKPTTIEQVIEWGSKVNISNQRDHPVFVHLSELAD